MINTQGSCSIRTEIEIIHPGKRNEILFGKMLRSIPKYHKEGLYGSFRSVGWYFEKPPCPPSNVLFAKTGKSLAMSLIVVGAGREWWSSRV